MWRHGRSILGAGVRLRGNADSRLKEDCHLGARRVSRSWKAAMTQDFQSRARSIGARPLPDNTLAVILVGAISIVAGARNHLQADRPLEFRFEIVI